MHDQARDREANDLLFRIAASCRVRLETLSANNLLYLQSRR
jgi:hypothetical protein